MNDTLQTLIRAVLKVGGGYLVAKGLADQSTAEVIISGLAAFVGVGWGIWHRTQLPAPVTIVNKSAQLLVLTALLAGVAGCIAPPALIAYRATATANVTANTALKAWDDFVAANHPPIAQQLQVKAAWEKAHAAELAAIDAQIAWTGIAAPGADAEANWKTAQQAAANSLSDLLDLVRKFGVKI
jgi:hypothetical protein